jgi:hypothetical protein
VSCFDRLTLEHAHRELAVGDGGFEVASVTFRDLNAGLGTAIGPFVDEVLARRAAIGRSRRSLLVFAVSEVHPRTTLSRAASPLVQVDRLFPAGIEFVIPQFAPRPPLTYVSATHPRDDDRPARYCDDDALGDADERHPIVPAGSSSVEQQSDQAKNASDKEADDGEH